MTGFVMDLKSGRSGVGMIGMVADMWQKCRNGSKGLTCSFAAVHCGLGLARSDSISTMKSWVNPIRDIRSWQILIGVVLDANNLAEGFTCAFSQYGIASYLPTIPVVPVIYKVKMFGDYGY